MATKPNQTIINFNRFILLLIFIYWLGSVVVYSQRNERIYLSGIDAEVCQSTGKNTNSNRRFPQNSQT